MILLRINSSRARVYRLALGFLAALGLLGAFTVKARVYEKHSISLLSAEAYAGLGWQQVYDTSMRIDGRNAEVQLWQSLEFPDRVLTTLEAHCLNGGLASGFFMGQRMGWGLSVANGDLVKHLVFSPDGNRNTFVLHIRTSGSSISPAAETDWLMPGATPARTLSNPETGLFFMQSHISASNKQVRDFYRDRFAADGWSPHLSGGRQSPMDHDVYTKKGRLSLLSVKSTGQDRLTQITMVQQEIGDQRP